jgi:predicted RNase H-like HicB family nuclease
MRRFKVLLEWDADDSMWVTYVPSLNHLSTFGPTRDEALSQTRDAILGYLEAAERANITVSDTEPEIELVELELNSA